MKYDIFARQHILPSMRELISEIERSGHFGQALVWGKDYSTIAASLNSLQSSVKLCEGSELINAVNQSTVGGVVLDEGGEIHDLINPVDASKFAGVEQTTFGLRSDWRYPSVLVCRSGAKLWFESQIIARGICRKLDSLGLLEGYKIGLVGVGALGSALIAELGRTGIHAYSFDTKQAFQERDHRSSQLFELVSDCDLVLGCTGTDFMAGLDLSGLSGRKVFVSCSSTDIEFRSLLHLCATQTKFGTQNLRLCNLDAVILNGGFPINFDREREWELPEEISLTRHLCADGAIQATGLVGSLPRGVMLNPSTQLRIVSDWLDRVPERGKLDLPPTLDEQFFMDQSEGEHVMSGKPSYSLHSTTPGAVEQMRGHTKEYDHVVQGLPILVLPNVWSPAYDWSSLFYVENLVDVKGRSFLEIGSGTGVISVFAGLGGASRVVAVDVNPDAVLNTRRNFERFSIQNADAFVSDGFAGIKEKFDILTWNAPYHGARPADVLERGCTDEDYRDIKAFFRDVPSHLNRGGAVVFGFSESGDLPLIRNLIKEAGLRVKRELSDWRQGYNCMLFDLVVDEIAHRGQ